MKGFTLIEMTVVLAIIGIVLYGVMGPLAVWNDARQLREEQRQQQLVRRALTGYLVTHGYLPCPDTDGDGLEDAGSFPGTHADHWRETEWYYPAVGPAQPPVGPFPIRSCTGCSGAVCAAELPYATIKAPPRDTNGDPYPYAVTHTFVRQSRAGLAAPNILLDMTDAGAIAGDVAVRFGETDISALSVKAELVRIGHLP